MAREVIVEIGKNVHGSVKELAYQIGPGARLGRPVHQQGLHPAGDGRLQIEVALVADVQHLGRRNAGAAAGQAEYEQFTAKMSTPAGKLLLIGWSFAFFFHLGNGIRHLVWDTGRGFEKSQANSSAWFVISVATAATVIFWVLL